MMGTQFRKLDLLDSAWQPNSDEGNKSKIMRGIESRKMMGTQLRKLDLLDSTWQPNSDEGNKSKIIRGIESRKMMGTQLRKLDLLDSTWQLSSFKLDLFGKNWTSVKIDLNISS